MTHVISFRFINNAVRNQIFFIHSFKDLSPNEEGKILKVAFLSSNLLTILFQVSKGKLDLEESELNLLSDGIDFVNGIDEALQIMFHSETNLLPFNADAIRTVDDLTGQELGLSPDQVKHLVENSRQVLEYLIKRPEDLSGLPQSSIMETKSLFRLIQTIALQKLDQQVVPNVEVE